MERAEFSIAIGLYFAEESDYPQPLSLPLLGTHGGVKRARLAETEPAGMFLHVACVNG